MLLWSFSMTLFVLLCGPHNNFYGRILVFGILPSCGVKKNCFSKSSLFLVGSGFFLLSLNRGWLQEKCGRLRNAAEYILSH